MDRLHITLWYVSFLVALLCGITPVYAQEREIEVEAGLQAEDINDYGVSFDLSCRYHYWLNPYMGLSFGGVISKSGIDRAVNVSQTRTRYLLSSKDVYNFRGILAVKLASPVYKKIGVTGDLSFLFSPIPYHLVSFEKEAPVPGTDYFEVDDKSKMVYTRFSPSYAVRLGVFYKMEYMRITVGCGFNNFNPYNGYYHAKIDGHRLRDYSKLKPDKVGIQLFVGLAGVLP